MGERFDATVLRQHAAVGGQRGRQGRCWGEAEGIEPLNPLALAFHPLGLEHERAAEHAQHDRLAQGLARAQAALGGPCETSGATERGRKQETTHLAEQRRLRLGNLVPLQRGVHRRVVWKGRHRVVLRFGRG